MLNEPTNNNEENDDDSVYHFSDEEYEVSEGASSSEAKGLAKSPASSAKRLAISVAIFFVLVYIVYKIVSPSNSSPDTDIAPVAVTETKGVPVAVKPAVKEPMQPTKVAAAPVMPVVTPPSGAVVTPQPLQSPPQPAQAVVSAPTPMPTTVAPTQSVPPALAEQPSQSLPQQPVQAIAASNQQQPIQQPVAPQPMTQQPQQSVAMTQPTPPLFQPQQVNTQPVQAMPTEQMPAQQPVQNVVSTAPTVDMQQVVGALANQVAGGVNAQTAKLSSEAESVNNQLQTEYVQRLNDYGMQNKILLNQIETLSAKVATMETQLNQLVQALTRAQNQQNTTTNTNNNTGISMSQENGGAKPSLAAAEPRSNYNVQAIIPGRAWLKSENGETLTVAEGDAIQSLGRVTKIDPYDGVVEINTGNKMISLSYGSA